MSLFIKGIEMPKSGEKIIILTSSGYVEDVSGQVIEGVEAVSVPTPHGRLVDADELLKDSETIILETIDDHEEVEEMIKYAPTVIEAEE